MTDANAGDDYGAKAGQEWLRKARAERDEARAPELLAALKIAFAALKTSSPISGDWTTYGNALDTVGIAIARAEGRA